MTTQFKAEDTPTLESTLENIDLETDLDRVRIFVDHPEDDVLVVNDEATVVDAANGTVEYAFSAAQTARAGTHRVEYVVEYTDGSQLSYPPDGYIRLQSTEPLDRDAAVDEVTADQDLSVATLYGDQIGTTGDPVTSGHFGSLSADGDVSVGGTLSAGGVTSGDDSELQLTTSGAHLKNWGDAAVIVDSNNENANRSFSVRHDGQDIANSSELFSVNEDGSVNVSNGDLDVSGAVSTEQAILAGPSGESSRRLLYSRHVDNDDSTPLEYTLDTIDPNPDILIVRGGLQGQAGSGSSEDVEIQIDGNTGSNYDYQYISGGSISQVTGATAWRDGYTGHRPYHVEYRIRGSMDPAGGSGARNDASIRGMSGVFPSDNALINGRLQSGMSTITPITIKTTAPATGRFEFIGVVIE